MKYFKTGLLALFIILFTVIPAFAASLVWDASTGADGYIVYYSDGSNNWSKNVENVTTYDLAPLNMIPGTTYTIYVTAYNVAGESAPSNSVTYTPAAFIPSDNPAPVIINIPPTVSNVTINVGQ